MVERLKSLTEVGGEEVGGETARSRKCLPGKHESFENTRAWQHTPNIPALGCVDRSKARGSLAS